MTSQLYEQIVGIDTAEISRRTGYSARRIRALIRRLGVNFKKVPREGGYPGCWKFSMSPEQWEEFQDQLANYQSERASRGGWVRGPKT